MDEVERSAAFRFTGVRHAFQTISTIPFWNIDSGKHHGRDRTDDLDRTTLYLPERSPQDFMSPHDFHQTTLEDFHL